MLLSGSLKLKSISQCCHKLKIFPHLTRHYKYDKVPCCVMFVYFVHVTGDRMIETTCCRLAALRDQLARRVDACRAEPQRLTTPTPLHRPSLGCHTSNSPQVHVGIFVQLLISSSLYTAFDCVRGQRAEHFKDVLACSSSLCWTLCFIAAFTPR